MSTKETWSPHAMHLADKKSRTEEDQALSPEGAAAAGVGIEAGFVS